MKELQLHNLENKFLSPQAQEIQKLAFYARFLVLSDFDDGWKYQLEKQLLDYLANLDFSGDKQVDLEIEEEIDEKKGEVFAVLKAKTIDDKTAEKIVEISTILQQRFKMTPVLQEVGYIDKNPEDLKIVLEDLEQEEKGYERQQLQKLYADMLKIEYKLQNLNHQLKVYENIEDEYTQILKTQLEKNIELLNNELEIKKQDLEKLLPVLYQKLALKEDNSKQKEISQFQAEAMISFTEVKKQTQEEGILELFKKFEEIYKQHLERNQQQVSQMDLLLEEKLSKMQSVFDGKLSQIDTFYKQVEELLASRKTAEVVKIKKGILSDYETDKNGYLIKAKIFGRKNSEVALLKDTISGFELDGISEKILSIKVVNGTKKVIDIFEAKLGNSNTILAYIENEQYKLLEIDGEKEFKNIELEKFDKNLPLNGKVLLTNGNRKYFYLENGKYKVLELEGEKEFDDIIIDEFDDDGKISRGKVKLQNGSEKYFYTEDDKLKVLEVEGEKEFDADIYAFYHRDNKNLSGVITLESGNKKYFYFDNGKYVFLEIDGEKEFIINSVDEINKENGLPLSGILKGQSGNQKWFYMENGEYKVLEIEGETEFGFIRIYKENNNVPIYGEVTIENGNKKYFYLEDGKYKFLEIDGETEFVNIGFKIEEELPLKGKVELQNGNIKYFYLKDGKYKFIVNKDNIKEFLYMTNDNNGNIVNGYLKLSNGKQSYFYLENGDYKLLEIDGETEFNKILDEKFKNDILVGGFIELEDGLKKYFYLKDGKYKFLEIDGEKIFQYLKNANYGEDNILESGILRLVNGKHKYIYLKNGKYKVLEIEGEREFINISNLIFNNGFVKSGKIEAEAGKFEFERENDGTYKFKRNFLGNLKKVN